MRRRRRRRRPLAMPRRRGRSRRARGRVRQPGRRRPPLSQPRASADRSGGMRRRRAPTRGSARPARLSRARARRPRRRSRRSPGLRGPGRGPPRGAAPVSERRSASPRRPRGRPRLPAAVQGAPEAPHLVHAGAEVSAFMAFAVEGRTWCRPCALADDRASGWKLRLHVRDRGWSASGRRLSAAACSNANLYSGGIGTARRRSAAKGTRGAHARRLPSRRSPQ
jgi:hypothetical protein